MLHYGDYAVSGQFVARKISIKNNTLKFKAVGDNRLYYGGSFSSNLTLQRINAIPAVQQQYVQGRSVNGKLQWQGPHTNELFSYGPDINSLEFDGTNYPYDVNGKLVAAGSGNGSKSMIYTPSIFRTAALFSNTLTLQAKYLKNYQHVLSVFIKAGHSNEKSFIQDNKNNAVNFSTGITAPVKRFDLGAQYNYTQENFSNSNRSGFLNRVYQYALLTPVSFDNSQGNMINTTQRSYSLYADNPFFLLQHSGHNFLQQHHTGNYYVERAWRHGKMKLTQAFENLQQQSNEGYVAGTAFFTNGFSLSRYKTDVNNFFTLNAEHRFYFTDYRLSGTLTGYYMHSHNDSKINYPTLNTFYHYQRTTNDAVLGYSQTFYNSERNFELGAALHNKIYTSTTATENNFFLPDVSLYSRFDNILNTGGLWLKLKGSYSRFNSELPVNTSFAQIAFTKIAAVNAVQQFPINEVNSFSHLQVIEHKENSTGFELNYKYKYSLSFDWFSRHTLNDVFPMISGGLIQLMNLASHRNRGVEVIMSLSPSPYQNNKFNISNSIAFTAYRSRVTAVRDQYNYTATAGFSDVYKAIVKDAPLGAIVGNSFLKDANNNIIIGTDGFPLVNNTPAVIGNPTPDFIIKINNHLNWKRWDLSLDWEWRKGGDIWNGTAALLDYYGRSANTAAGRNTTNYVFAGVDINGKPNNIPVSFYNTALPIEQNRWVRYGPTGVAESYIQKGDCIRLNNVALSFKPQTKKYLQQLTFSLYASNFIIWTAYKGADVNQLLNDQSGTSGLDFFNFPSYHSLGLSVSLKF